MSVDLETLKSAPRILIEASLKPIAGSRIQPTGFPDLGPAIYQDANDVPTLLVESALSMANRLEAVCWDEGENKIAHELEGLPYVNVKLAGLGDGGDTTNSLQEFHRLNSPYIMNGKLGDKSFADVLKPELGLVSVAARSSAPRRTRGGSASATEQPATEEPAATDKEPDDVAGVVNLRKLAEVCFKYDPNSLVHGVFLEKIAGRLRHPRALSAFIEATGVGRADSGGVKFDRALPKPKVAGVDAKGGYGNVPFHRTEFTAKAITAFFSLDLSQIRGYGLPADATSLLEILSLWKVRKFLDSNMRLRSACELELTDGEKSIDGKRPKDFKLPGADELAAELKKLIGKCNNLFAKPVVTELTWKVKE
jgi:CRISPR-associated protein Csb1